MTEKLKPAFDNEFPALSPDMERLKKLMDQAGNNKNFLLMQEIKNLREEKKLTIPEIAQLLGMYSRSTVQALYSRKSLTAGRKALEQGCMNAIVAASEITEIVLLEVSNMKVKSLMGELNLTPEQTGTLIRAADRALELSKVLAGKKIDEKHPLADTVGTAGQGTRNKFKIRPQSALDRARANLEAIEAKGKVEA